ncbi:MAG: hypothetical protein JWO83_1026 [Caulobacteraceae bacterium]|nr:hypothetical protein [Caulobacteraceae bacterium]
MSILDKVVAAVTPPESDETRAKARQEARAAASPGDWLSMALDHHLAIEGAFAEARAAREPSARRTAQKKLATLLTGHSMAEEAVLYPAIAQAGEKAHAILAYTEQAAAKMQMAALEEMDPMSEDYLDKLGHLEGAVKHHVYEEEGTWFIELKKKAPAADQPKITDRFKEQFERYMGVDSPKTWNDGR